MVGPSHAAGVSERAFCSLRVSACATQAAGMELVDSQHEAFGIGFWAVRVRWALRGFGFRVGAQLS